MWMILVVGCSLLWIQPAGIYAQNVKTLHFIYFSDTNDSEIGKSSEEANRYFINNFVPMIKRNTSLNVRTYYGYGPTFQRVKLNRFLSTLQTGEDDAIFFYYTGHGYNPDTDDFPTLTLGLRGDALSERTKSLLDIYNTLRAKPHRLLLVMAEACNAVYGSRSNSGNYTGNYDAFEGDNSKLQQLFGESAGDYLMSSSKKGEKSYCPTGGLGYFTRAFRDALDERTAVFTIPSFLDKVAKNATKYASDYAAEDQHPQWLSGVYADGKSKKPSLAPKPVKKALGGEFSNVTVSTAGDDLVVKGTFTVDGMKDKRGRVVCYFYDEEGNALKDLNQTYRTTDGNVSVGRDITPKYESTLYTDLEIRIPQAELHQEGTYARTLKTRLYVWDNSSSESKEVVRSGYVTFKYKPVISYLKVDGATTEKTVSFNENGGRNTFSISTNASSFETWGLPSWCRVENVTSSSFTLVCDANPSRNARNDYMKVKAAGKEVKISISQSGKTAPSANIENVWVDHNIMNGMFRGMLIHVKFTVDGMKNQRCNVVAAFYYADNVTPLKNPYGGYLTYSNYGNVIYDSSRWDNFTIFVPYNGLYFAGRGTFYCSFDVLVNDAYGNCLAIRKNFQFTLTQ